MKKIARALATPKSSGDPFEPHLASKKIKKRKTRLPIVLCQGDAANQRVKALFDVLEAVVSLLRRERTKR